jgi:hypothetical protein
MYNEFENGAIIIEHIDGSYTIRSVDPDNNETGETLLDELSKTLETGESIYLMKVELYHNNYPGHFKS